MSKVMRSPKEEEMKKYFKFSLICNFRSKEYSLVAKSLGRANNNYWKSIYCTSAKRGIKFTFCRRTMHFQ